VGYSKYTEDIVDRWVEDNREREAEFYCRWNLEHVPPAPPATGDIYLQIEGKRLEDEEVFPAHRTVRFSGGSFKVAKIFHSLASFLVHP